MIARNSVLVVLTTALLLSGPALALNPGTDLYVPAAARARPWIADLSIDNPGTSSANMSIAWLPRDTDNSGVTGQSFGVRSFHTPSPFPEHHSGCRQCNTLKFGFPGTFRRAR